MIRDLAFEVESTVEKAGQAYVLARRVEAGLPFEVPPGATLGGFALDELLNIPIASGAPGQRGELFVFCLHAASDVSYFVEGDRVMLQVAGRA